MLRGTEASEDCLEKKPQAPIRLFFHSLVSFASYASATGRRSLMRTGITWCVQKGSIQVYWSPLKKEDWREANVKHYFNLSEKLKTDNIVQVRIQNCLKNQNLHHSFSEVYFLSIFFVFWVWSVLRIRPWNCSCQNLDASSRDKSIMKRLSTVQCFLSFREFWIFSDFTQFSLFLARRQKITSLQEVQPEEMSHRFI